MFHNIDLLYFNMFRSVSDFNLSISSPNDLILDQSIFPASVSNLNQIGFILKLFISLLFIEHINYTYFILKALAAMLQPLQHLVGYLAGHLDQLHQIQLEEACLVRLQVEKPRYMYFPLFQTND